MTPPPPIAGLIILHRNFLELREFDRARRTLVCGAIAVLAYAFQGLRWPKGDNLYLQYIEALDGLQANLSKVAAAWSRDPVAGGMGISGSMTKYNSQMMALAIYLAAA